MFPRGERREPLCRESSKLQNNNKKKTTLTESGSEVLEERSEAGGLMNYGNLTVYCILCGLKGQNRDVTLLSLRAVIYNSSKVSEILSCSNVQEHF